MRSVARKSRTISDFKVPTVEEIREARKKRPVAVMLTVFGDESFDKTGQRVYAVAGLLGTQEEWDNLGATWLKRTKGVIFHATDCEANRGDFKGVPHKQNLNLYKDLVQILANSGILGFAVAIDVKGYREIVPGAVLAEAPYFHGFTRVVVYLTGLAKYYIPPEWIQFVFHQNINTQYNAGYLFNFLVIREKWKDYTSSVVDPVAFSSSKAVGIQAAGLLAREAMKDFENVVWPSRQRRISMLALIKSKRFTFDYWDRKSFEDFKEKLISLDESNENQKQYEQSLVDQNCNDNAENRIRFLFHLEWKKS